MAPCGPSLPESAPPLLSADALWARARGSGPAPARLALLPSAMRIPSQLSSALTLRELWHLNETVPLALEETLNAAASRAGRSGAGAPAVPPSADAPLEETMRVLWALGRIHPEGDALWSARNRVIADAADALWRNLCASEPRSLPTLLRYQIAWLGEITIRLGRIDSEPILGVAASVLHDRVAGALRTIVLPPRVGDLGEALLAEIASEVERAGADPRGIGAVVAGIVSRLREVEESLRIKVVYAVLLVAGTLLTDAAGVSDGRHRRRRSVSADGAKAGERWQHGSPEKVRRELAGIAERLSSPPTAAEVIRVAHLRARPDAAAGLLRRLEPGTRLLVLERRDGWVRGEVEPVPGDVSTGWVCRRQVRYAG
jgi:hypothetical protein